MEYEPADLLANDDPVAESGKHGFIARAKSAYIVVFDNEHQLHRLYTSLKVLKKKYPHLRTHGGRIDQLLQEFLKQNGDDNQ